MKKLFILSILFSLLTLSCDKDPEPEPEETRAFCHMYHFVSELEKVIWVVDDIEVPDSKVYAGEFKGSVELETAMDEINFTVKHSVTGAVLLSEFLVLEEDKFYTVIAAGTEDNPVLLFHEFETTNPQSGQVKFEILHSVIDQGSIDVYMGGTSSDKRVVSDLSYNSLSLPFEVAEADVRAAITVSAHSEEYSQDSVLLTSVYNEDILSDANYFSVVAPFTFDPDSDPTFWLYLLPQD